MCLELLQPLWSLRTNFLPVNIFRTGSIDCIGGKFQVGAEVHYGGKPPRHSVDLCQSGRQQLLPGLLGKSQLYSKVEAMCILMYVSPPDQL